MTDPKHKPAFLLGNILLGLSLLILIFMGALWEYIGAWAMALWIVLAGAGMVLVVSDKGASSDLPD